MTAYGIDEAWARLTPAQVRAAGKTFVVGYVGQDTTGKNLTKSEVDAYRAAGVAVLLVYEYSATAVHGGASAGTTDADLAVRQAQALGYPQGCAIAFAVDEDTSANPSIVDAYARAFTARVHAAGYRSMVYGGLATVRRCADLELTDLHWQAYAWSGGVWDPRAAIRQVQNGVTIAGVDVDLDTAMTTDYGAWAPGGDTMPAWTDTIQVGTETKSLEDLEGNTWQFAWKGIGPFGAFIRAQFAALQASEAASKAAIDHLAQVIQAGGGSVDTAAITAHIDQAVAAVKADVEAQTAKLHAAAQAATTALSG